MTEKVKAGRYRIEKEIGRGGMGVVYRARDLKLPRAVAIKMLPPELVGDPERRRRLAQEAHAASALNHPGIATVYDYEEQAEEVFLVSEYVEGSTLRARLAARTLRTEDVLDIGVQLADALAAAHDRGIVHRDLKPENIMLTPGPQEGLRTKILDFGLAKLREPLADFDGSKAPTAIAGTAPGLLVGTVNYMAPEQAEGEPADHRADIHAVGLLLYEMAAGTNPFAGRSPTSTIANILKQPAPPLTEHNPLAPAELDRIVRKCLRKRREERYQSARELLVDLSNLRRDLGVAPAQATSTAAPPEVTHGFVPRSIARVLVLLIQAGYLAMYGLFAVNLHLLGEATARKWIFHSTVATESWWTLLLLAALIGTPVRFYLFSAVAMDFPDLGRKFRWLFPAVILMDLLWATAPLLVQHRLGGFVLVGVAVLAYLPFSQRWLIYDAYSPRGGRSSVATGSVSSDRSIP